MKRVLTMGVLAVAIMALTGEKASAWTKSNFSVGLSFNREASDNSLIHGWLYQNGPHPFAQGGGGYGGGYGGYSGMPAGGDFASQPGTMPYASESSMPTPSATTPAPVQRIDYPQSDYAPVSYWNAPVYYWQGN